MKKVAANIHHLSLLGNCNSKLRKAILRHSEKDLVFAICECVLNLLNGNVKTDSRVIHKLGKHKQILRKLVHTGDNVEQKRKLLIQKGGFLPLIIPAILEVVTSLLSKE
jgi:hypothetical protein